MQQFKNNEHLADRIQVACVRTDAYLHIIERGTEANTAQTVQNHLSEFMSPVLSELDLKLLYLLRSYLSLSLLFGVYAETSTAGLRICSRVEDLKKFLT